MKILLITLFPAVCQGFSNIIGDAHLALYDSFKGGINTIHEVVGNPVKIDVMSFFLSNKELDNIQLNPLVPKELNNTTGKIYFIVHGWQSNVNITPGTSDICKAILKRNPDANAIQVDWSIPASDSYALAAFSTESVGQLIAELIKRLIDEYNVKEDQFACIGHSLGGQICGWVGKYYRKFEHAIFPRIYALDPAGPIFLLKPTSKKLNKDDAKIVEVVHTDSKFGYQYPCGTTDFFPNGGFYQPGCYKYSFNILDPIEMMYPFYCDHLRVWDLFEEAVLNPEAFPAEKCANFKEFINENCTNSKPVNMGDLSTEQTGNFFFSTNSQKPFSMSIIDRKLGVLKKISSYISFI